MKIKKMQQGGMSQYMAAYQYQGAPQQQKEDQVVSPSSLPKSTKTDDGEGLLDSAMYKILKDGGLPSDIQAIIPELVNLEQAIKANPTQAGPLYAQMTAKLMEVKFNYDQSQSFMKNIESNGATGEMAMTTTGQLVTMDRNGKVRIMSGEKYKEHENDLQLLTNADVYQLRARNSNLGFNNELMGALGTSRSTSQVTQEIEGIIDALATQKYQQPASFSSTQDAALDYMMQMRAGTLDVESTRTHGKQVMNYIASMLDPGSLRLLQNKAVISGLDRNTGPLQIINEFYTFATYENAETSSGTDGSGSGGGNGITGSVDYEWQSRFANGQIGNNPATGQPYEYQMQVGGTQITTEGRRFQNFEDTDGNPLPNNTTVGQVIEKALPAMTNTSSVSVAGQKIEAKDLSHLVTTGGEIMDTMLPLDRSQLAKGIYVPDLTVHDRLEKARKESKGVTDQLEIDRIYRQYNVEDYVDANTQDSRLFGRFLVAPIYVETDSDLFDEVDMRYVRDLGKADDSLKMIMHNARFGDDIDNGGDSYIDDYWTNPSVYETSAFIHVTNNKVDASPMYVGKGQLTPGNLATGAAMNERQQELQMAQADTKILHP